jgi:hypothetical protein
MRQTGGGMLLAAGVARCRAHSADLWTGTIAGA